jgi:hypothetical protein
MKLNKYSKGHGGINKTKRKPNPSMPTLTQKYLQWIPNWNNGDEDWRPNRMLPYPKTKLKIILKRIVLKRVAKNLQTDQCCSFPEVGIVIYMQDICGEMSGNPWHSTAAVDWQDFV